jgi:iron(III) transport system substrate-binding protein
MTTFFYTLFIACSTNSVSEKELSTPTVGKQQNQSIVVYSGRGESMVGELFKNMEEKLQINIEVQYAGTQEMVTRMLTEGDQSPADIIFAQDSGHLGALANKGQLATLPDSLLNSVDPKFRDEAGTWVGTSGRLRVLVYDSEQIKPEDLPKTLKELADPKWKNKLGWAPGNSSFQSHVSVLRNVWGEEETKKWLTGVIKNSPKRYPKNSPQVSAANEGSLTIGWVNHYYLHRLESEKRKAVNYSFPSKDAGNVMMLAGVGIRKNSPNKENAEKVIAYLTSVEGQSYFTLNNYEYPTRPNVPTHKEVPDINLEHLLEFPQHYLSDLGPTRTLIQELSLQ